MKPIQLSPKHGVNPTIPVCAWCGEPKKEIAFLGKIKTDKRGEDPEAPKYCVLDYEPCEHCKGRWNAGVPILEATATTPVPYRPAISKDANGKIYPTMRMVVLKIEVAKELFNDFEPELGKPVLLEDKAFEQVFGGVLGGDK